MNTISEPYQKLIYWSLTVSGLWTLQTPFKNKICRIICFSIIISLVLPQLVSIKKQFGASLSLMIEACILFVYCSYGTIKYLTFCLHHPKIKYLLHEASNIHIITEKKEVEIAMHYTRLLRFYSMVHLGYASFALGTICLVQCIPFVVHTFSRSENRTQLKVFQNPGVYFIDLDDHSTAVNSHMYFASGVLVFLHEGLDLFFLLCAAHVCKLLAVLRHRLRNIGTRNTLNVVNNQSTISKILCQEIKNIVQLHCYIFEYLKVLETTFNYAHMSSLFLCIILVPLSFYTMHYCLDRPLMAFQFITFSFAFILELLFLNLVGQRITTESNTLLVAINWYEIPVEYRNSLLIIMNRSVYPMKLTAGKIAILSAETYQKAMKSALSYLTLLLSIF